MGVIVADSDGRTDGPAYKMLSMLETNIPIVLMSRTHNYKFNEELLGVDKYILCEFSELGWDWKFEDSHVWGLNTYKFSRFEGEEYKKFDEFVASKPPLLTFTRELLQKDVRDNHRPIDYPSWYTTPEIQPQYLYDSRPITAMMFWGRSHEARVRLHARIWHSAYKRGYSVCDNLYHFEQFMMSEDSEKWVTLWMPHYARIEIKGLLDINGLAKIGIALPGAGIKTFRHTECSVNSTMLMYEDDLAWSYEWKDNVNCIKCLEGEEIDRVYEAVNNPNLYEIYKAGVENNRKYHVQTYLKNYIYPIIKQICG